MNRLETIRPLYVVTVPDQLEQGVLYISREYETAIHSCACGCGVQTVTPIDKTGWQLTENANKVTLDLSISNMQFPCGSHYWIRDNKIEWW
jgi:Family of unknown function (DUF6527)